MSEINPNIQRISLEEIQEFSNLDLFSLTWEQTNERLVLLAYDPRSQTFVYSYSAPGTDGGNQNISLFYGYADLISQAIDFNELSARPSINGFDNGDGIIAMSTVGTVNKFDFYDVEIDTDLDIDRYIFRVSIIGGAQQGDKGDKGDPGVQGPPGEAAQGVDGITYLTANVFTRTSTLFEGATVVVTGGRLSSPTPTLTTINAVATPIVWSDGIPPGTEKVWMTSFQYDSTEADVESALNIWSTPVGITDTATTDYQYSTEAINPGTPLTDPGKWDETILDPVAVVWLAQRATVNGIVGPWVIIKIKGETGETGAGLEVQGRDTPCNILNKVGVVDYTIWLASTASNIATMFGCSGFTMLQDASVNDAFLKVPTGTGEGGSDWDNIGSVVGTDGASFKYSIVFKRSVGNPGAPTGGTFALPIPSGWSDGIPTLVVPIPAGEQLWMSSRHFSDNTAANNALSDWITPVVSGDTIDQEVSYAYEQPLDATPAAPNVSPLLWSDIPGETEYFWSATAKKINGVVDNTTWKINRIRGEKGTTGESALNSFLASAYLKTNVDVSAVAVTGGTYLSPVPTSTADGENWSDGIPEGPGAIWFTQVRMEQTDTAPGKVWPAPIKIIDSSSVEYRFSAQTAKPTGMPVEGDDTGLNSWWDDADLVPGGSPIWMAIGAITNNVWPTVWDIVRITGEQGLPGTAAYTYVPSTMFVRCENNGMANVLPIGKFLTKTGSVYELDGPDPVVNVGGINYTFTDGIPELSNTFPNNGKRVWMIQGVLNSVDNLDVGNEFHWKNPVILADSSAIDFQYHAGSSATVAGTKPAAPSGLGTSPDTTGWYSNPDQVPGGAFWIAQKNWAEGPAAQWVIYQIRGEGGSGSTSTPLVWTQYTVTDNTDGVDNDAQTACAWGNYYPTMNVWFSGSAAIGDFMSLNSTGTAIYAGGSGNLYFSNGVTSWRIDVDGKIAEIVACNVGGVAPPGIPGVYGSTTNANQVKIFVTPSSVDSFNVIHYEIFKSYLVTGSWVSIGTILPADVHNGIPFVWTPGANYGLYYIAVKAVTAAGSTPLGDPNWTYFSQTIQMYPTGFSSPALLRTAFLESVEPDSANVPYYVAANTVAVESKFMIIKTTSGNPFNGNNLWYANYTREKIDTTAYQINQFGEVIATAAIDFPAQLAISISQPNAGEGVLSITNGQPNEVIILNVSFIEDVLGDALEFEGPQFLIAALESLHDTRSGKFILDAQGSGTSLYSIFPGTSLPTASITILTRSSGLPLPFVISVGINP